MAESVELKKGDNVEWKHAPFASATIEEVLPYDEFKIRFTSTSPLQGSVMKAKRSDLKKLNLLKELAIAGDETPPDPFFRAPSDPNYLKEHKVDGGAILNNPEAPLLDEDGNPVPDELEMDDSSD